MLAATLLALAAAALHAGWNLGAKRSADRVTALSAQFIVGGVIGAAVLLVTRDLPAAAWWPAVLTGLVHVPYVLLLAHAYTHGDFSVAYPVARGSGAVLAAIGGVVLLDDDLSALGVVAVVTVAGGDVAALHRRHCGAVGDGGGGGADDRRLHRQRQPGRPSLRHHVPVRRVHGDRCRVVPCSSWSPADSTACCRRSPRTGGSGRSPGRWQWPPTCS